MHVIDRSVSSKFNYQFLAFRMKDIRGERPKTYFLAKWISVRISHEIWMISGMKSGGFHEIYQISCLKTFKSDNSRKKLHREDRGGLCHLNSVKSTEFHEIWWISCEIWWISCLKALNQITQQKNFTFNRGWGGGLCHLNSVKSARFHEIHQISWNLVDFMKSTGFHETLHRSDNSRKTLHFHRVQGAGYVIWNLKPDRFHLKFGGFHEIQQDFTKSNRI